MDRGPVSRLLAFARELQLAATFEDLLQATSAELSAALGYQHAWLFVADHDDPEEVRLIDMAGGRRGQAWEVAPVLKIKGDAMLEEVVRGDRPVVVEDARTDPRTNKQIVAQLGNRTIITVPLRLLDRPFGAFGTGTFDEEGCRPPTPEQLDYLLGMAGQMAVAAGRIRFLEERKRAEAALSRTQEQLRHAQKMEAVGRLAGGVAHDFNNLLSVILAHSDLLLRGLALDDPVREGLEEIRSAGERAAELTRQLLAFSRQQVIEPRIVDLSQVVIGMGKLIRRLVGEDVELRTLPRPGLGKVRIDPGHLEQIVMNLVVNARDAMPNGGVLVLETGNADLDEEYAREHVGATPGPHVMLAVSDTGIGMDRATQDRIFEPFFTTKELGKGSGLGLSTVYGIVEQSGGNIWVHSEPGKGTTFKVYLPRTDAEQAQPVPRPAQVDTLRGSETVLLVEDDDQVRAVVARIVRGAGYRVLEARGGAEALQMSDLGEPIHLLLTDVVMPAMSGRQLAEKLRAARPDLRVLFMSGYTHDAMLHHGVLEPGFAMLHKPITPDALLRRLREVLATPRTT